MGSEMCIRDRKKAWRGEIKAWTVRMKYRRKGVGSAVLEEAVREARRKGAESLEFAYDHASQYSRRQWKNLGRYLLFVC